MQLPCCPVDPFSSITNSDHCLSLVTTSRISKPSTNLALPGNSTYAGATAAIVANIVLLSYVVVAFQDDKSEREADIASGLIQPSEGRKDR